MAGKKYEDKNITKKLGILTGSAPASEISTESKPVIESNVTDSAVSKPNDTVEIPNDQIFDSPYNKGLSMDDIDSLAESLKKNGLIEPVVVYRTGEGRYELISGHRRRKAWCEILGNEKIPCVIRPYEENPEKRFSAHTEANSRTRAKDLSFWISRIAQADEIIAKQGIKLTKMERVQKMTSLLGLSQAQFYRYDKFSSLIPELQKCESHGWITASTLYAASGLDSAKQTLAYERILMLHEKYSADASGETPFEVTRPEFEKIVNEIKNGENSQKKTRIRDYTRRCESAREELTKAIRATRNREDITKALEFISSMKTELEALETELKG